MALDLQEVNYYGSILKAPSIVHQLIQAEDPSALKDIVMENQKDLLRANIYLNGSKQEYGCLLDIIFRFSPYIPRFFDTKFRILQELVLNNKFTQDYKNILVEKARLRIVTNDDMQEFGYPLAVLEKKFSNFNIEELRSQNLLDYFRYVILNSKTVSSLKYSLLATPIETTTKDHNPNKFNLFTFCACHFPLAIKDFFEITGVADLTAAEQKALFVSPTAKFLDDAKIEVDRAHPYAQQSAFEIFIERLKNTPCEINTKKSAIEFFAKQILNNKSINIEEKFELFRKANIDGIYLTPFLNGEIIRLNRDYTQKKALEVVKEKAPAGYFKLEEDTYEKVLAAVQDNLINSNNKVDALQIARIALIVFVGFIVFGLAYLGYQAYQNYQLKQETKFKDIQLVPLNKKHMEALSLFKVLNSQELRNTLVLESVTS